MTPFMNGFADELVKLGDENQLTRVSTSPKENPVYTPGVRPAITRALTRAKRTNLQRKVNANVAKRPLPTTVAQVKQNLSKSPAAKPAGQVVAQAGNTQRRAPLSATEAMSLH